MQRTLRLGLGAALTLGLFALPPTALAAEASAPMDEDFDSSVTPAGSNLVQAQSNAFTSTVANDDGTFSSTISQLPINYLDDGSWTPIDTELEQVTVGEDVALTNAANSFRLELPADAATDAVRLALDGFWVSSRLHGLDGEPSVNAELATYDQASGTGEVEYESTPVGVKENIRLFAAADVRPKYTYTLAASAGSTARLTPENTVEFKDAEGVLRAVIPAPYMYDSADESASSTDVRLSLIKHAESWTLELLPDQAWLTDAERHFPLVIDPSLTVPYPIPDCWVLKTDPTQTHCNDGAGHIRVGRASSTEIYRGLLRFNVSAIPQTAEVTSATASLFIDSAKTTTGNTADFALYRAGKAFDSTATWASSGAAGLWATGGGDPTGPARGTTSMSGNASTYKNFDGLAGTVEAWTRGTLPNNGLVLKMTSESVNNVIWFNSSSGTNKPKLYVDYKIEPPSGSTAYTALASPAALIARNSTLGSGAQASLPLNTSAGFPADTTQIGSVAIRVEADQWTSIGDLKFENVGDAILDPTFVTIGTADTASEGIGQTILAVPSATGVITLRNLTNGSVRVSVTALGWYGFADAPSDDVTSTSETDPYLSQNIGSVAQTEASPANTDPACSFTPMDPTADYSTVTETEIGMCADYDGSPISIPSTERLGSTAIDDSAADGWYGRASSPTLTNQGSCWPADIDPDYWEAKRYEACNVTRVTIHLIFQINAGPPQKLGEIKVALWRMVQLGQTNTAISTSQQLSWIACSGRGCDPGRWIAYAVTNRCESDCGSSVVDEMSVSKIDKKSGVYERQFSAPLAGPDTSRAVTTDGKMVLHNANTPFDDDTTELHGSPYIRCDSMSYFNQGAGCVFRRYIPAFGLSVSDQSVTRSAEHIAWHQQNRYPWGTASHPLTRTNKTQQALNRKAACGGFKPTMSCDEFPFASTAEGCYNQPSFCSVWDIPKLDNSTSGARLGAFYRRSRIMRDTDQFLVKIQ